MSAGAADVAALARRIGDAMAAAGATAHDVAALAGGTVEDDGAPLAVRSRAEGVGAITVSRRWDSDEPDAADLALDAPVALDALAGELGEPHQLPRPPSGGPPRVRFGDGEGDWTALGVLGEDDGGAVTVLTVRRESG